MKLPDGDRAVVDERKLKEYVLNPEHPIGRHHAILFDRLLGITQRNADVLRAALMSAATSCDIAETVETPYGKKFKMRFPMSGPRGERSVVAVWIVEHGRDRPRLVTSFVE